VLFYNTTWKKDNCELYFLLQLCKYQSEACHLHQTLGMLSNSATLQHESAQATADITENMGFKIISHLPHKHDMILL
jgi:hypothetical protein